MYKDHCFYRVSIKAIIEDEDGGILLLQEKSGLWELPGGGLEYEEKIDDCLNRELGEEVGTKIESISPAPKFIWQQRREKDNMIYHCLFLAYKVKVKSIDIKVSDECVAYKYFNREEMTGIKLHPNLTQFVKLI